MSYLSRAAVFCSVLSLFLAFLLPKCLAAEKVDVNTASSEELTKIIHIGDARAKELISLRPFSSLDDLSRIKGISEARVKDIKDQGVAFIDGALDEESIKIVTKEIKQETSTPEEQEWTKEQTLAREEVKEIKDETQKTNYSLISLPLVLASAGTILLLKKNIKIK
jgi:predicted flap endonuclease-1-like 5' DNA nuclease